MAFNYEYPYTDAHRHNDDWLINKVKELALDWLKTSGEWKETQEAWGELKRYIMDYFNNLDVQEEINVKLETMASDGTLRAVIAPLFNEYQEHIAVLEARMDSFTRLGEGDTTGDAELTDARVDHTGKEWENVGGHIRAIASQLSSEIANVNKEITSLTECIYVECLGNERLLQDTLINLSSGVETTNVNYVSSDYIETKSKYIRFPRLLDTCSITIHCYDESKNWLRATTPLKQGDIIRAYLGNDVKYIRLVSSKNELKANYTFIWTNYVFDFKGKEVDYYYTQNGVKSGVTSIEYEFECHFINIPIYGSKETTIGLSINKQVSAISGTEVRYSGLLFDGNTPLVKVTFPKYVEASNVECRVQVGKPFQEIKCCVYGTSISNDKSQGKYPLPLKLLLGCNDDNFVVRGISGGCYATDIKANILSHSDTFDLIVLEGCANDWATPIAIEDCKNAIYDIMDHLHDKAKNIVFVIDHNGRNYGTFTLGAKGTFNGLTSREYYLECAKMFSSCGAIVIDAGMLSGISEFKEEMYVDQIHHSTLGGYTFAKAIYDELIRLGIYKE